jgi:hypothetical protein
MRPPRPGSSIFSALPTTSSSVSHSFEVKTAGLNTRHIEQVIHQPRGIQHMLADLAGLKGVFRAFAARSSVRISD